MTPPGRVPGVRRGPADAEGGLLDERMDRRTTGLRDQERLRAVLADAATRARA